MACGFLMNEFLYKQNLKIDVLTVQKYIAEFKVLPVGSRTNQQMYDLLDIEVGSIENNT